MENKWKKEQEAQKVQDYKALISEIVGKIENPAILKRIYQLAEYLYVHKNE